MVNRKCPADRLSGHFEFEVERMSGEGKPVELQAMCLVGIHADTQVNIVALEIAVEDFGLLVELGEQTTFPLWHLEFERDGLPFEVIVNARLQLS